MSFDYCGPIDNPILFAVHSARILRKSKFFEVTVNMWNSGIVSIVEEGRSVKWRYNSALREHGNCHCGDQQR